MKNLEGKVEFATSLQCICTYKDSLWKWYLTGQIHKGLLRSSTTTTNSEKTKVGQYLAKVVEL